MGNKNDWKALKTDSSIKAIAAVDNIQSGVGGLVGGGPRAEETLSVEHGSAVYLYISEILLKFSANL